MSHVHKDKSVKKAEKHATNIPVTTGTGLGAAPLVTPAPVVHRAAIPVAPVAPPVVMPVAGMQTLSMADRVVNEPERIIRHEPIIEKEILREPALEVKREHHIQPIVHETEHRIQPIIKTEATTEQPIIEQDRNVMMEPVLERAALPVGLEAVERVAPEGIIHAPKLERQIVNERPVEVRREHHVQPIIHEREHRIQPIIKTEATTERTIIEQDINVMHEPIVERAALPAGLEAVERVAAEGIIHRPRVAKDVIVEHPVQIRHEHHVQPIIHEREHHIQPIIKTEITAEETHLKTDRNVMLEPILERAALPAGLEAVERAGPEGVLHRAKLEKEVIQERTLQINREHHIQPIIHERVHHIQPIIKTEVTTEQPVIEEEHSVMLPPIIEPTVLVDRGLVDRGLPVLPTAVPAGGPVVATTTLPHTAGLSASEPLPQVPVVERGHPLNVAPVGTLDSERGLTGTGGAPLATDRAVPLAAKEGALGTTAATTVTHKPTVGQRLKGAVKQLQGSITGNEVKKEEGKLISEGIDPATAHATAVSQSTAGTLL